MWGNDVFEPCALINYYLHSIDIESLTGISKVLNINSVYASVILQ